MLYSNGLTSPSNTIRKGLRNIYWEETFGYLDVDCCDALGSSARKLYPADSAVQQVLYDAVNSEHQHLI